MIARNAYAGSGMKVSGSVDVSTGGEASIVERARKGDDDAFEDLVRLYGRRLIDYCARMAGGAAAEDLAQEILVKLYLAMPGFEKGRPLRPFLFRIAHNHCLDALRRRSVATVSLTAAGDAEDAGRQMEVPDGSASPEDLASGAETGRSIDEALASLPPLYRSAIVLRHREGMTYEEMAEALDVPLGTVQARIHRGRRLLQQKLSGHVLP